MDARFEIIVDVNGSKEYLDTYTTEPISLNYNIADLTNISARNSSYSKTIKVPETKNNRQIFGNIADLSSSTAFDPNKKTRAWILVDNNLVMEGYLQLRFVNVDRVKDYAEYEVVIFAENDNFFKALGEKFLTDLDWSELNHVWDGTNIQRSWTASSDSLAYFYPLIDYGFNFDYSKVSRAPAFPITPANPGGNGIEQNQFFPSTNVKYMVDKIFREAGYTYESNFLNSKTFKKLYIPFSGQKILNPGAGENLFSAGRITATGFNTQYTQNPIFTGNPGQSNYVRAYPTLTPGPSYNYTVQPYDFGVYRLPFNSEAAPNGDPDGVYDPNAYEFTSPASGLIRGMRFICDFDLRFEFGLDFAEGPDPNDPNNYNNPLITYNTSPTHGPAGSPACWIAFRRNKNTAGTIINDGFLPVGGVSGRINLGSPLISNLELLDPIDVDVYEENNNPEPSITRVRRWKRVRGTIVSDYLTGGPYTNNYRLNNNEKVWVEIKLGIDSGEFREQINQIYGAGVGWGGAGTGYFVGPNIVNTPNPFQGSGQRPNVAPGNRLGTFSETLRFYNDVSNVLLPGDVIDYNEIIPKQVKNKDFISSLVKMFNLYIEPSKNLERHLIIEPRDDYYAAGEIKNWTNLVDLYTPIKEQILAETQNREFRFKYRDDTDYYNEDFRKKSNIGFGEFRKILDNDFTTGIQTIEPLFSPTPLVLMNKSQKIITPKIGKLNNNVFEGTENNFRILTRYEPEQTSPWAFGGLTTSQSPNFPDYAVITSQGIGTQRTHAFNPGDVITINQNDGGTLYPALQGTFEVIEVINNRTIVIDVSPAPTWVGYIAGIATPQPGVVGADPWWFIFGNQFRKIKYYPYLGHFSHPRFPNYDLNFSESFGYYHPLSKITNNTLYKNYWKKMVDEITDRDSRIITVDLNLSSVDIAEFRFSDNIFIDGQYYRVNKIMNYDPTSQKPAKVELIKVRNITIDREEAAFGGLFGRYEAPGPPRIENNGGDVLPTGILTTNDTNFIRSADSLVVGRDNSIAGNDSMVVGTRNNLYADENYVLGSLNTVNNITRNNFVVGSNNEVLSGVENSFIFGNNLQVSSSNTMAFGGILASVPNMVSASKNQVLSPFNSKPPNFISGSKNSVFEWGSTDPVNEIRGQFYYRSN